MRRTGETAAQLRWLPLVVLVLGLVSTIGAAYTLAEVSRSRAALRFATNVAQTRAAIQGRIDAHISLLRGVAGLFAADDSLDRAAFSRYVEQLDLRKNYPGVQGLGFSARVAPAEHEAFIAQAHAMGLGDFHIWPDGPRAEYHTILFLEPLDRRNRAAIGFDMYTEPTRREAMARARDTAQPALSMPVTLVQEIDEQKQTGFLIYMPIYRDGQAPASVELRREQLLGFAYSPFRADDLFRGIFGATDDLKVAFAIYDGAELTPAALLHRSPQEGGPLYTPAYAINETIEVAGRPWTIIYSSQPDFDATGDAYVAPLALVVGTLISLVLFVLVRAQTIARQQAELAVAARDSFLSVASHELKTPLTALSGNAQLLQRRTARDNRLSAGERRNVEAIVDATKRLSKLVDELLDHTRLQGGRLRLQQLPLDLDELVGRVAEEIRPTLSRHALTLHRAGPLPILGDPMRLEQVLLNLIGNAAKYSPSGGPIEIILHRTEPWAVVQVRDHGIGIPAAALPRLFEQFYRAPNALDKHIAGMGIGLYVVKEIVERHGGAITAESVEGQGSSFRVCLPLTESALALSSPGHQSDPPVPLPRP